jgi:hypothetical protein
VGIGVALQVEGISARAGGWGRGRLGHGILSLDRLSPLPLVAYADDCRVVVSIAGDAEDLAKQTIDVPVGAAKGESIISYHIISYPLLTPGTHSARLLARQSGACTRPVTRSIPILRCGAKRRRGEVEEKASCPSPCGCGQRAARGKGEGACHHGQTGCDGAEKARRWRGRVWAVRGQARGTGLGRVVLSGEGAAGPGRSLQLFVCYCERHPP